MKITPIVIVIVCSIVAAAGCTAVDEQQSNTKMCSNEWYALVEHQISTGDNHGHGPDVGSIEWRSVVEFKLGIRDENNIPQIDSEQWCKYINDNYVE